MNERSLNDGKRWSITTGRRKSGASSDSDDDEEIVVAIAYATNKTNSTSFGIRYLGLIIN